MHSEDMPPLLVLKGVRAFDPGSGLDIENADVLIERGIVTRVGRGAATTDLAANARVVEVKDALVLPAFVDLHAHLREPGEEYKEDIASGLAAAAAGGFAHVCAMPNTKPVNDRRSITEAMIARARAVSAVALHPIGAITMGQKGAELTEMADLKDAGAVGVSDDGHCVMSANVMRRALEYARTFDLPVIQHAEDHTLTEGAQMHEGAVSTRLGLKGWPRVAEDIIVARDVLLAEATGGRYHVAHVSTRGAVRILREAKARGLAVTAEVTPHHLVLTDEACLGYDTACKVNPPLREAEDIAALREALDDGTIDAIATDHAPHSSLEKDCEFVEASPGMMGLELVVPVLFALAMSGELKLDRVVAALTRNPSRIVGIDPPSLRTGTRANLVLVDPHATFRPDALRTKARNSPLLARAKHFAVRLTLAGGRVAFDAEKPASPPA